MPHLCYLRVSIDFDNLSVSILYRNINRLFDRDDLFTCSISILKINDYQMFCVHAQCTEHTLHMIMFDATLTKAYSAKRQDRVECRLLITITNCTAGVASNRWRGTLARWISLRASSVHYNGSSAAPAPRSSFLGSIFSLAGELVRFAWSLHIMYIILE